MKSLAKPFAALAAALLVAACGSGSGSGNSSARSTAARSSSAPAAEQDEPAVYGTIRDCRVVCYDPRTSATIILVNKKHAWRNDVKGQLSITNGKRNATYKVLTDRQIDALLETMRQRGSDTIRENFHQRHAALLRKTSRKGDRFKGLIIIENEGRRYSYIARTPMGDPAQVQRYQVFRDMREAVFFFERAGLSEQVGTSATGSAPLDRLEIPRDGRR